MAVHTKHPVAAPPTAPIRATSGHLLLRGWCIFVLAAALAGSAWPLALGIPATAVAIVVAGVVSASVWALSRPPVQWRRLPWFALAYVLWAVCSLLWTTHLAATAATLVLLLVTTMQALFVGAVLTWRELVRAMASALKWVLGLSLLFELWVSVVWHGVLLPGFARPDGVVADGAVVWSHDQLMSGGRIQGIVGDATALAFLALLGMVVFAVRFASRAPRRTLLVGWFALSAFLFFRAGSALGWLGAAAVVLVLATVLVMRTTKRAGERTRYYVVYAVIAAAGILAVWLGRGQIFSFLGRSTDLDGREGAWALIAAKALERPLQGWGFATPWPPLDAASTPWGPGIDSALTQAHSVWLDVLLQLGIVGMALLALTFFAYVWRSWFFAVDRPRWDLVADRPYSPVTLVPTLTGAILLVQGVANSGPIVAGGWLLIVMLAFKIKQAPLLGRGASEERLVGEQGETERVPR